MKKEKAYKIVRNACPLRSLCCSALGKYAIEYSDKKAIIGNKVSFVFGSYEDAIDYFGINAFSEENQLWECEGYFVDMPKCFEPRSVKLNLVIMSTSKFMKNVRLTMRII